ncbi:MAG: hypothetical protein OXG04_15945 [Acidobacteria bacterium]|nr:hypothetical protein [Acidobacteriota bacterium]
MGATITVVVGGWAAMGALTAVVCVSLGERRLDGRGALGEHCPVDKAHGRNASRTSYTCHGS